MHKVLPCIYEWPERETEKKKKFFFSFCLIVEPASFIWFDKGRYSNKRHTNMWVFMLIRLQAGQN